MFIIYDEVIMFIINGVIHKFFDMSYISKYVVIISDVH